MKTKKYYIILSLSLILSLILISTSYSKKTNETLENNIYKETYNDLEITYDNTNILLPDNDNVISIINKKKTNNKYIIKLIPTEEINELIYYQIDNGDIKLLPNTNIILEEELSSYGSNNDQITHTININSTNNIKYYLIIDEVQYES